MVVSLLIKTSRVTTPAHVATIETLSSPKLGKGIVGSLLLAQRRAKLVAAKRASVRLASHTTMQTPVILVAPTVVASVVQQQWLSSSCQLFLLRRPRPWHSTYGKTILQVLAPLSLRLLRADGGVGGWWSVHQSFMLRRHPLQLEFMCWLLVRLPLPMVCLVEFLAKVPYVGVDLIGETNAL